MSICQDVVFSDAWTIWWSGEKLDGHCIAGWSAIKLGRLAKVIALLSSIPLIIDILGEERVQHSMVSFGDHLNQLGAKVRPLYDFLRGQPVKRGSKTIRRAPILRPRNVVGAIVLVALFVSYFLLGVESSRQVELSARIVPWYDAYWRGLYSLLLALASLNIAFLVGLGIFTAALWGWFQFLRLAVFVLRQPVLCRMVRAVSALLLLLAFGLDIFVSA